MPMRPMAVSKDDLAFGREFTNLSARQADDLRTVLLENKQRNLEDGKDRPWRMPRLPADRVRAYYELVEKRTPPPEILENLVGGAADPEASTSAKKLAKKFNIDLRQIPGSGANGQIIESDVRKVLAKIVSEAQSEGE